MRRRPGGQGPKGYGHLLTVQPAGGLDGRAELEHLSQDLISPSEASQDPGWRHASARGGSRQYQPPGGACLCGAARSTRGAAHKRRQRPGGLGRPAGGPGGAAQPSGAGPEPSGPSPSGRDRPLHPHQPGPDPACFGAPTGGPRPLELRPGAAAGLGRSQIGSPVVGDCRHGRGGRSPSGPGHGRCRAGPGDRELPAGRGGLQHGRCVDLRRPAAGRQGRCAPQRHSPGRSTAPRLAPRPWRPGGGGAVSGPAPGRRSSARRGPARQPQAARAGAPGPLGEWSAGAGRATGRGRPAGA